MHTIVLAEPRRSYGTLLEQTLSTRFRVVRAATVAEAMSAVSVHGARALVAGLFQSGDENGLELCGRARRAHGKLITIAYGAPNGGVSAAKVMELEQEHGLAVYLARTIQAGTLSNLLIAELQRELATTSSAQMRRLESASKRTTDLPSFSARIRKAQAEDTWAEIMKKDVSMQAIKELASKPVAFDPIDRSWSDEDPTWTDLMKTKATPSAMKALARKSFGIKVKKPA